MRLLHISLLVLLDWQMHPGRGQVLKQWHGDLSMKRTYTLQEQNVAHNTYSVA